MFTHQAGAQLISMTLPMVQLTAAQFNCVAGGIAQWVNFVKDHDGLRAATKEQLRIAHPVRVPGRPHGDTDALGRFRRAK